MQNNKVFVVDGEGVGDRLDVFLEKNNPEYTRSHLKKQIENGEVFVNDKIVKAGYKLKFNDKIDLLINPPKTVDLTPVDMQLDIVYQDLDYAVVNKPQGLVVHPAVGNWNNTLVNALLYQIKDLSGINGEIRPGIVHRLDKDTSGLLIIAKNDNSHVVLSKQIQTKVCKRYYYALVNGVLENDEGEIKSYISRDKKNRLKMSVNFENDGKYAETHYKVVERFKKFTLVEFELKTGRTHQIRVHASYLKHPVVGDELYGNLQLDKKFGLLGQLLHAYKIEFYKPSDNSFVVYTCELPKYFKEVLEKI